MLAPSASRLARPSRLLPAAATPLVLAIRGGEHDGRLIRIRSAKCTVGSAAGCTLRLRSPGVKPLHCWILRGPGGTIVRRCAGDAQLNGAGFLDAQLAPGFRLRVGPVELEVVRCPVAPREAFVAPPVVQHDPDRELLEQTAREAAATAARLREEQNTTEQQFARQLAEVNELVARLSSERDSLTERTRSLERQSEGLRNELTSQRDQVNTLRDDSQAELTKLQNLVAARERELESLRREAAEAGNQSVQMTMHMDELRRTAEDEQSRLEQERQTLASEAQSLRDALAGLTSQLREAQQSQQQLDADAAERQTLQAELSSCRQQIEELQADLAKTREELAAVPPPTPVATMAPPSDMEQSGQTISLFPTDNSTVVRSLQDRISELEANLHQEQATLTAEREQLAAARTELQQLQSQSNSQRNELEATNAAKEQLLNRQAAELSDRLERAESRQMELDRREQELRDQAEQNEILRGKLRQCQAELDEQRVALEQRAAQLESQKSEPQEPAVCEALQQTESPAEVSEPVAEEATPEVAMVAPVEEPAPAKAGDSQSVESVLSRLMQAGLWKEGGQAETPAQAQEESSSEPEPVAEQPAESQPVAEEVPAEPEPVVEQPAPVVEEAPLAESGAAAAISSKPVWTQPAKPAASDDESIESYMDRLLKRVRGESAGAPQQRQAYQPVQQSAPKAPEPLPEIKPVAMVQETVKPEEYIPRSQAPEQGVNLAAMRELANSAARSAIEKHAKTRGGKQAMGSFAGFGVCVGLTITMVVLAIFTRSWLVGGGALFGLAVSAYWALQGTRHMLGVMRLGKPASQTSKVAEEPAQEATTQARSASEGK